MPGNTLGGVNLAAIAQRNLDALLDVLLPVRAFATDFSDDAAMPGESITTRVATQPAIQDFTSTTDAADVTTTAKTVTLSNYKGVRIGFTDLERANSAVALDAIFTRPVANTVGNAVIDSALALVTNSNYSTAAFTGAASTFDADDVADLAQVLSTAKVQRNDRFLIIGPTYFANLVKDNAVQSAMAFGGAEAIRENRIPRIHGFSVYEYTDVPANGENLVGLCGAPQGILVAARVPSVPGNFPGDVEVATDPETGLTIQVRRWYSADDRKWYIESGLIYGVAVGVAGNVKRITSA